MLSLFCSWSVNLIDTNKKKHFAEWISIDRLAFLLKLLPIIDLQIATIPCVVRGLVGRMFYNMLVEMAMNDFFVVLGSNKHLHPGGNPFSRMQRYGFRAPGSTFPYIVRSISLVFFYFFLRCGVYLSVICHFFQIFFPGFLLLNRFFLGFMIFFTLPDLPSYFSNFR